MKNVTRPLTLSPAVWARATAFHGHACPGLALGCRMVLGAVRALGLDGSFLTAPEGQSLSLPLSPDEELVCVAESDACCVDAVQVLLGCTLGKGNLLLKLRGKTALSVYYRPARRAVRLVWTAGGSDGESRESRMERYLYGPGDPGDPEPLYSVRPIPFEPPRRALISASLICAGCGEPTAEYAVRLRGGKPWCLDCFPDPSRIL